MLTWLVMLWRRAQLRLSVSYGHVMEAGGVVLDSPRRQVLVDGYVRHLSAREATVLGVLMIRPGQVVYRPVLVNAGWGTQWEHPGAVDRLMRRLRRRIEPSPVSPIRLRRVGEIGYIFGSMTSSGKPGASCPPCGGREGRVSGM